MVETSLAQEFNKLATEAHEAFPQRLDNLVVFSTSSDFPSGKLVFAAPKIAAHLAKNPDAVEEAIKEKTKYMHAHGLNSLASYDYSLAGTVVKIITMNENPTALFSSRFTEKMRAVTNFEHEMGHLVVKNGAPFLPTSLSENSSDVYAAFLTLKHYGDKTDFFEYYNRAHAVVLDASPIHYTNNALQRVKQLSEEMDISNISLHKAANLAERISLEYSLDDATLKKISTAFLPVKKAFKKTGSGWNNDVIKECVKVMQEHAYDPDIYNAGEHYLNYPPVKEYIKNHPVLIKPLEKQVSKVPSPTPPAIA